MIEKTKDGWVPTTPDFQGWAPIPYTGQAIGQAIGQAGQPSTVPNKMDFVQKDKLVEGYKADEGKVRMDLIPPEAMFALAEVLTFGAQKYEDRNWEKGMKWSRPFGALMRHMWAWWRGESTDKETGYSHLWHAICCIAFLITYEQRKAGTDDRK